MIENKKFMVYLLLIFLSGMIYANDNASSQHICDFSLLPKEIQNHIASYIRFSNIVYESKGNVYEPDGFLEKLRKSSFMLKEDQLSMQQTLKIDKGGLYIITNDFAKQIIEGKPQKYFFSKEGSWDRPFTVKGFIMSPNKNFLGVLVNDDFQLKVFFYVFNRTYLECEKIFEISRDDDLYGEQPPSYDEIAISNDGHVVFSHFGKVFILEEENKKIIRKKIYSEPEKFIGPFLVNLPGISWVNTIVGMRFSNDGNKLGLKFHYLYEILCDMDRIDENHTYNEAKFKELMQQWYSKTKTLPFCDGTEISFTNFLTDFYESTRGKYGSLFFGYDDSCPIKIIPFNDSAELQEQPWTLEKYFRLKGVCKDLHNQCGFK